MSPQSIPGLVSVIIPTWNRKDIISNAIDSVLQQSYENIEVLICDDGSTDATESRIAEINDARVKWIPGIHSGLPAAPRNTGLRAARGEWIAFLDSDDVWQKEKLAIQLEALKRAGGTVLASCSNAERYTPSNGSMGLLLDTPISDSRLTLQHLFKSNAIITSSVVFHRSLLKQIIGFPVSRHLKVGEDYALWLRVASKTDFLFHAAPLLTYTDAPEVSVRAFKRNETIAKFRVLINYFDWAIRIDPLLAAWRFANVMLSETIRLRRLMQSELIASTKTIRKWPRKMKASPPSPLMKNRAMETDNRHPEISVLMPVFNGAQYLTAAIDSILGQSFSDFELIVIDDASTDASASILAGYRDHRIKVITHERNQGIVAALNNGMAAARGNFIARMDADDISEASRFQVQHAFLCANPEVGLVGSWIVCFGDVRKRYVERYPQRHEDIRAAMLFENPFAHSAVMFRRALFQTQDWHYSARYRYVEDWTLWSAVQDGTRLANIPSILLRYRINKQGSSYTSSAIQTQSGIALMQENFARLGLPFDPALVRYSLADASDRITMSNYLDVLQEKNLMLKPLDPAALARCIDEIWLKACRRTRKRGFAVAAFYLRHPHVDRPAFVLGWRFMTILCNSYARYFLDILRNQNKNIGVNS